MGTYIHYFESETEFNQARKNNYIEPWVSLTEGEKVAYNKSKDEKLLETPFTIEALGSGNINWALGDKTVQYSKNGSSWETMDSGTTISVAEGDEVQFKGMNTDYSGNTISATAQFNAKGNIMSLADDEFETADTINANGFRSLFSGCTNLISASDLKLPATTLADSCYVNMFYGCANLTAAPELPATTLASSCYYSMFYLCTSLTTAPELPATTLANYCYQNMFYGCTNLTTAPALPATTLTSSCYRGMFGRCAGLTTAPELPATTLASNCYYWMFQNCTHLNYVKAMFIELTPTNATTGWLSSVASTGTFVKNASAIWTTTGANGVPTGWTVQTASA